MKCSKLALACVTLFFAHGCGSEEASCVPSSSPPSEAGGYLAKAGFMGRWSHVATLGYVEGDLALEAATTTGPSVLAWTIREDLLLSENEATGESQFAFAVDRHGTLGTTTRDVLCTVENEAQWFERDHFRVDWTTDLVAAEASIPGASDVDTSEWLVEPLSNFVEPGIGLLEMEFTYDSSGRLESFFLPMKYSVRPCDGCGPSVVNVFHRFERVD